MKKKIFLALAVVSALSLPLVIPRTSSAFWPFSQGEVKGESTDTKENSGIFGKIFKTQTSKPVEVVKSEDMQEDEITEEKLLAGVKNRTITEAQRLEIKTRLAAIKAKRAELKSMREAFTSWLKLNNLERNRLMELKPESKTSISPTKRPTVTPKATEGARPVQKRAL